MNRPKLGFRRAYLHKGVRADYLLANPPLNDSDRRGELLNNDQRWAYATPSAGNANFLVPGNRTLSAAAQKSAFLECR